MLSITHSLNLITLHTKLNKNKTNSFIFKLIFTAYFTTQYYVVFNTKIVTFDIKKTNSHEHFTQILHQHSVIQELRTCTFTSPANTYFNRRVSSPIEPDQTATSLLSALLENTVKVFPQINQNLTPWTHAAMARRLKLKQPANNWTNPKTISAFFGEEPSTTAHIASTRLYQKYTMLDDPSISTSLDVPSISTMLDVPAPPMLDEPAQQSPTLDAPVHLAYPICMNSPPLWTFGCMISRPSNPHDLEPAATVDSGCLQLKPMLDVLTLAMQVCYDHITRSTSPLFWNFGFIAPEPSNLPDPRPSTSIKNHIATSCFYLVFSVTAITAVEAEAPAYPLYIIWRIGPPLWTLDFIIPGPSNPHDPGPSATVAVHPSTLSLHLIFSVIAIYAINDFLCIPPRSPSSAPVFICSVCL
jgi:hypothetical protein